MSISCRKINKIVHAESHISSLLSVQDIESDSPRFSTRSLATSMWPWVSSLATPGVHALACRIGRRHFFVLLEISWLVVAQSPVLQHVKRGSERTMVHWENSGDTWGRDRTNIWRHKSYENHKGGRLNGNQQDVLQTEASRTNKNGGLVQLVDL